MAQLIQCDFCGNITNQITARIIIQLNTRDESTRNKMEYALNNGAVQASAFGGAVERDCCSTCVNQFLEVKTVPLAITPSGEAVKSEDL